MLRVARALAIAYVAAALMLVALQRRILFPAPPPRAPAAGTVLEGRSAAGRRVVALWSPRAQSPSEAITVAYLHGNGMQLADCAELAPALNAEGWNVLSVEYPGYGPLAADAPSEEAIVDVADGAMALLRTRLAVPPARTVLLGQSLGTGVATALAARGAAARVVLMSPFRSVPAVAAAMLPWLPVRFLVRDRFDSEALAPSVTVPVRVIHGTADEVIPFSHGAHLATVFPRGELVRIEGGHHNDLWDAHLHETLIALRGFVSRDP